MLGKSLAWSPGPPLGKSVSLSRPLFAHYLNRDVGSNTLYQFLTVSDFLEVYEVCKGSVVAKQRNTRFQELPEGKLDQRQRNRSCLGLKGAHCMGR